MKKIILLLLILVCGSCSSRLTYCEKYGYQKKPLKNYRGENFIVVLNKKIRY